MTKTGGNSRTMTRAPNSVELGERIMMVYVQNFYYSGDAARTKQSFAVTPYQLLPRGVGT